MRPAIPPAPTPENADEGLDDLLGLACNGETALGKAWADAGWLRARWRGGESALEMAAIIGHERGVETLLALGADPDESDVHGWSALHTAARQAPSRTLALIAKASKRLDALALDGRGALALACQRGSAASVQAQLDAGCLPEDPPGSAENSRRIALDGGIATSRAFWTRLGRSARPPGSRDASTLPRRRRGAAPSELPSWKNPRRRPSPRNHGLAPPSAALFFFILQ